MQILDLHVPLWLLDWSGSLMLVVSLIYLWSKRSGYWWWGNAPGQTRAARSPA